MPPTLRLSLTSSLGTVSYTHLDVYKRQGLYPVDIRDELIYNNCVDDDVENVRNKNDNNIVVRAKINGCLLYTSRCV